MRLRTLGGTGIKVSPYCLGAMMFGAMGNADHDESVRMIHTAFDAGINFVDTADVYSNGESEEILGKALKGRRDDIVVASKAHLPMGEDANRRGGSRRWLVRAVEDSLRRLGTDHLDLYQLHRPDEDTALDETLGALSDLVRSGKVRAVGTSTFPAELIVEMQWESERRGHVRLRTEQPPYSIFNRAAETSVLPTCARYGMGVLTWGPLNRGWLTGRYRPGYQLPEGAHPVQQQMFHPAIPANARKYAVIEQLLKLAADSGHSLAHLAVAFVLSHPAVTSAIIGPRTPEQLADLLAGKDTVLEDEVLNRIDELVPPGTVLNPDDSFYQPPGITDLTQRRRPRETRAAV
ncbi:aldo/keto reductase [Crossiella sp. CA198]|uniref:aldo/keto reductase n=1 Tax=Crossiella sp. CA198 TaxID=3455607 RepID=UPI003F8D7FBD